MCLASTDLPFFARGWQAVGALLRRTEMTNQIMVLAPYWLESVGTWVFDDPLTGLSQEPFVSGIPEMIDVLVKDIPNARKGFRLIFSAESFPGYQKELWWENEEMGGNWYSCDDPPMLGWLCPAFLRYFDKAPPHLYVKAEAKL
jgi:hypothetical protein